tara:strand:- start:268 stop:915 length:648 start_codon:yes stop_codon:yes gene_type:complete
MQYKNLKYRFIYLGLLPVFLSFTLFCDKLEPDEYRSFIRKNKSSLQRISEGEISRYKVVFIPEELKVINALNKNVISLEEAEERLKQKQPDFNFLLQINIPENGREEFLTYPVKETDYKSRLMYYSFEMKSDISVYINQKKVALNYYQFERDFGLSPQGTISFSVEGIPYRKIDLIEVHINDEVYGRELHKVSLDTDFIQQLPKLKNIKKWKKQL